MMFMPQQRGTTTDRLANIIQVLQLGRKTGHLTVERGEGAAREQGEILFVHGQVIEARAGQFYGQQALSRLNVWGACRFMFYPSMPDRVTGSLPALAPTANGTNPQLHTPAPLSQDSGWRQTTGQLERAFPVPRRKRRADEALQLLDEAGFSRLHRRLFLLVDGHRTMVELVRLMGRGQDEVQRLLSDLIRVGLVEA
jgi:hypothetical protein